ncbi:hypothetical protein Cch01nite_32960 [Cellulomonas chitinilytica]|uniref:Uncharacterized protein n=1 Tax=Cellulomonas chitinilytica TaxID=398759 RepID=A0A919P3D0_9CELL|nr:hypothetical protein [Cellulomonas chitinilytica]GIG22572.1 hypothetical protein Cch01nite_32960 [Cellulomonas chitinilytica]
MPDRRRRALLAAAGGAALVGLVLGGTGTASASMLAVGGSDAVASGVTTPTTCSTASVSTAPVFVDGNPTKAMTAVDVTGIPAGCAGAWVLVTGRDAGSAVLFTARAQHTGTGTVRVTVPAVTATAVVAVEVTVL